MKRALILFYGLLCYGVFLAVFLYAIGFIGNFAVPTTLDATGDGSFARALLVNLGLLGLSPCSTASWPGPHSSAPGRA